MWYNYTRSIFVCITVYYVYYHVCHAILYKNYYITSNSLVVACMLHILYCNCVIFYNDNYTTVHGCKFIYILLILIITNKLTWPSTVLAKVPFLFHFASIFSSYQMKHATTHATFRQKCVTKLHAYILKDYKCEWEIIVNIWMKIRSNVNLCLQ